MSENLTSQDVELLIESLDAWVAKDLASDILETVLTPSIPPEMRDEVRADLEKQRGERKRQRGIASRMRKERAVCLQAKLIRIRDSAVANSAMDSANTPPVPAEGLTP